jgi:hypothetical protein
LSWSILCLGQYFGTDQSWTNKFGEKLHFEDLVRYELRAPVEDGACGGTHGLFGLTWAYQLHLRRGGRETAVWQEVAAKLATYQKLAKKLQNPDGSFSTNFFKGPGNTADRQLRMNTTGHIFEWLALSLPAEELTAPWMQDAANRLALMFLESENLPVESGSLYHAIHGLILYYSRAFDPERLGKQRPFFPNGEPAPARS